MKKKPIIMFPKIQSVSVVAIKLKEKYNCLKKLQQ